jgi:adenosylcobinamide-GDP ribazoletransferase
MRQTANLFLAALQFLTRLPVNPGKDLPADSLGKAAVFFPLVGLLVGAGGVALNHLLSPYVGRNVLVMLVLLYLVILTGGLHEDGLADAADGFGGGWRKEQILSIMRDSRIGSYGAIAITFSLLARYVCLDSFGARDFDRFLVAGQVLNRWTALPLGFFLPSARQDNGQGARVAEKVSGLSLGLGTAMAAAIVGVALGSRSVSTALVVVAVTVMTGIYFWRRIGGVTGDCMGAANQLVEATIYFTGVLLR